MSSHEKLKDKQYKQETSPKSYKTQIKILASPEWESGRGRGGWTSARIQRRKLFHPSWVDWNSWRKFQNGIRILGAANFPKKQVMGKFIYKNVVILLPYEEDEVEPLLCPNSTNFLNLEPRAFVVDSPSFFYYRSLDSINMIRDTGQKSLNLPRTQQRDRKQPTR